MIEKIDDLGLLKDEKLEVWEAKIQEKLGITVSAMQDALSRYVVENAETLVEDFRNIAPLGDYSKFLEERDEMVEFLKTEAYKPEHWKLSAIKESRQKRNPGVGQLKEPSQSDTQLPSLLVFEFNNAAIDEGDVCEGFVYVSFNGKIRHAFAQGDV